MVNQTIISIKKFKNILFLLNSFSQSTIFLTYFLCLYNLQLKINIPRNFIANISITIIFCRALYYNIAIGVQKYISNLLVCLHLCLSVAESHTLKKTSDVCGITGSASARRWEVIGSILGANRVIAKDFESCNYCCYVRCATLIVWVEGMPWPKTGATQYHTQKGLPDKGRAIKGLFVCYVAWQISMIYGMGL